MDQSGQKGVESLPDMFSWSCREELQGHVACVKLFLEEHCKYGTPYTPGSPTGEDHCKSTRDLYMRCMQYRKRYPATPTSAATDTVPPKACEMELTMHGSCVERMLERSQKLSQRYWTQGGEDKCLQTRMNYEKCMYNRENDRYGKPGELEYDEDYKGSLHKQVKAFDFPSIQAQANPRKR
eukprot:GHVQ01031983.1.p1 GENE.GHVQ01031983.1~~GHVQ01031983.1.p1  ORF type:complete len:181 (+),score=16.26 GHVQ01031983.1:409-951(+)